MAVVNLRPSFDRLKDITDRGQFALANQVLADSNQYVPELSGDLARLSYITNDNKQIVWSQPYATYQYYGQFKNYTKPGTGGRWDQRAASRHTQDWIKIVEAEARK